MKVDIHRPTLILTECLLVYMKKDDSMPIVENFTTIFDGDIA